MPVTTAADNIFFYFSEKTSLDISCESSACSDKIKKNLECPPLQILLGALKVNNPLKLNQSNVKTIKAGH